MKIKISKKADIGWTTVLTLVIVMVTVLVVLGLYMYMKGSTGGIFELLFG